MLDSTWSRPRRGHRLARHRSATRGSRPHPRPGGQPVKPLVVVSVLSLAVVAAAPATAAAPTAAGPTPGGQAPPKPPGAVMPQPPDPQVLRQGGDTLADAL